MRSALCLAVLLAAGCDAPTPETIGGAMQAYSLNRVAEAESIFRKIAADPNAVARDRAQAHRQLGRIAWLIDGDARQALAQVKQAFVAGDDRCATGQLEARILHEARHGETLLPKVRVLAA